MPTPTWYYGRTVYFEQWQLPHHVQTHNRGLPAHSALFLTTSKEYALKAARGSGGLCTATLVEGARVLDMNACADEASEQYRQQVLQTPTGQKNPFVLNSALWRQAWRDGQIMKFSAASPPLTAQEYAEVQKAAQLAVYERHTQEGMAAFALLQHLTRSMIETLVTAARELGWDAVIGNEIESPNPADPIAYEVLIVLNPAILTPPHWLIKPARNEIAKP